MTKEVELLSSAIAMLEYDARKRFCRIDSSIIKALKMAIIEINSSITNLARGIYSIILHFYIFNCGIHI